jgi:hypothetical protein
MHSLPSILKISATTLLKKIELNGIDDTSETKNKEVVRTFNLKIIGINKLKKAIDDVLFDHKKTSVLKKINLHLQAQENIACD